MRSGSLPEPGNPKAITQPPPKASGSIVTGSPTGVAFEGAGSRRAAKLAPLIGSLVTLLHVRYAAICSSVSSTFADAGSSRVISENARTPRAVVVRASNLTLLVETVVTVVMKCRGVIWLPDGSEKEKNAVPRQS